MNRSRATPLSRAAIGRFSSRITASTFSRDDWRGGTIGNRNVSSHSPITAIENFTGPGLDSQKFTCMSPRMR